MTKRTFLTMAFYGCFAHYLFSQYGTLDLTFSGDGIFTTVPSDGYDICSQVTTQPDGKLVTVGWIPAFSSDNYSDALVVRVHPNGTLDNSFNHDGILIMDVSNGEDDLHTVRVQPDGKIVVAGTSKGGFTYRLWLMRLLSNGNRDVTFGNLGMVYYSEESFHSTAYDIELLPDGKILVAGSHGWGVDKFDAIVLRYNPNGQLDETFGDNGVVIIGIGQYTKANDLVVLMDGSIIVAAGSSPGISANISPVLIKLNENGSLNNSFGNAGIVHIASETAMFHDFIAIAYQGKSIVLSTCDGNGFTLLRYDTPSGQLDETFGLGGKIVVEMEEDIMQTGLLLQPDGKIVASGYLKESFFSTLFVSRFTKEGDFDTSFGIDGIVRTSVFDDMDDSSFGICLQADGKIVQSAMARKGSVNYIGMLRYDSGVILPAGEVAGVGASSSVTPNPTYSEIILQYKLEKQQAIKITILDTTGKCVRKHTDGGIRNAGQIHERLLVDDLPKGIYFIMINSEFEGTAALKFIKG